MARGQGNIIPWPRAGCAEKQKEPKNMERAISTHPKTFPDLWGMVLPLTLFTVLVALALWMIISNLTRLPNASVAQEPLGVSQTTFTQETGIKLVGVAVVAGGGMLDLRYQVVDPDKAVIVHDDENPPSFIIEATGQVVNTPYHEHSEFEAHTAVTYHELIMNPAGVIKRGTEISVQVGTSRLQHIVVQ